MRDQHSLWSVRAETLRSIAGMARGEVPDELRQRAHDLFGDLPSWDALAAPLQGPLNPQVQQAVEEASRELEISVTRGVAVIPLRGLIMPRASLLSLLFGGGGLQLFRAAFRQALTDDDISAILIDVDSPGGRVDLVPETAREIRAARGTKPIVAVSNVMAASAAYYIASQADELHVTPSGEVGSIGVFVLHEEFSKMDERLGITTTLIRAGKYKAEGNPFEPLSDEAREAIQERVNEYYDMFVEDVAAGRGVSTDEVRGGFGEGRMITAKRAVDMGMADRVGTFEEAIAALAERGDEPAGTTGASGSVTVHMTGPARAFESAVVEVTRPASAEGEERELPTDDGEAVRSAPLEANVEAHEDGTATVSGYAAVFGSVSEDLGGFTEEIKRGAFRKLLRTKPDVRFLVNHRGVPLARTTSGTLRLSEDPKGLRFEADLPDTEQARELTTAIERGDLDQMSFRFRVSEEGREWSFPEGNALPHRTVTEIARLFDVSAVTFAAYGETDITVRHAVCGHTLVGEEGRLDEREVKQAIERVASGDIAATPDDRRELAKAARIFEISTPWGDDAPLGSDEEQPAESSDAETEGEPYGLAARSRRLRLLEQELAQG